MHLPFFAFHCDILPLLPETWQAASNWFIVSDPHDPMLELTQKLLFKYWKDHDYAVNYFIFYMFFKMATDTYPDEWKKVPFISNWPLHEIRKQMWNDYSDEKMKYFEGISDFHKMTHKLVPPGQLPPSSIIQHVIDSYR